jgi:polyhydroxybutyrate depolymerase
MLQKIFTCFSFLLISFFANNSPAATVSTNEIIKPYENKIDYYIPKKMNRAIVFLHGGGGKKEALAFDLGIKLDETDQNYTISTEGAKWLDSTGTIAIFPQGITLDGYSAWTWSNYVMTNGKDDVAFLKALVTSFTSDPRFTGIDKIYLAGHSNGGMMVNRMWCESPSTFKGYASLAGPASSHLNPNGGSNPCIPSKSKPYIGIIGNSDTVISTTNKMDSALWTISKAVRAGNPPTWVDNPPQVMNEINFYSNKIFSKCSESLTTPTSASGIDTYSNCGTSMKLIIVKQNTTTTTGGDHCLTRLSGPCKTTLAGDTGLDYKQTILDFFKGLN